MVLFKREASKSKRSPEQETTLNFRGNSVDFVKLYRNNIKSRRIFKLILFFLYSMYVCKNLVFY
jgi:hypothetical protein